MSQLGGDVVGPWGPGQGQGQGQGQAGPSPSSSPAAEAEHDGMSTAQKSTLKWEKEEVLGEMATVAPVLYSNINYPDLKEQHPGTHARTHAHTHTRGKQVTKRAFKCISNGNTCCIVLCFCDRLVYESEADC